MENRPEIFAVILGMHRSGTSLVMNILSKAGFFIGQDDDLIKGNFWNPEGYFERWSVCDANNRILQSCKGRWDFPPPKATIEKSMRNGEIQGLLSAYQGSSLAALKDPRMCLTFPVWRRVIGKDIYIIRVMREPESVVGSLARRNGFSREKSLYLWREYNKRADEYAGPYPCFKVEYEKMFSAERPSMLKGLSSFLGLDADLEEIASSVVDPSKRHYGSNRNNQGEQCEASSQIASLYGRASGLLEQEEYEETIQVLQKILEINNKEAMAHNSLGFLYSLLNDPERAEWHLKQAVTLRPGNKQYRKSLAVFSRAHRHDSPQKRKRKKGSFRTQRPGQPAWADYPRMKGESLRVLLVSVEHLLLREIKEALERLGHLCAVMLLGSKELPKGQVEKQFCESIKRVKPDFILTINHLGFDHEGVVASLLTRCRIPYASWYVDSPHLIIRHYSENRSPYLNLFMWDEDYIDIVRELGFENSEYLPLGTDERCFRPLERIPVGFAFPHANVGFVGNSMVIKTRSKLNHCGVNGPLLEGFDRISEAFNRTPHLVVRDMLNERFPELASVLAGYPEARALEYETAVTWHATGKYRRTLINRLLPYDPLIVGDRGWKEIIGNGFRFYPEVNYYKELPLFYNAIKVSFNATSRQMKQGVNQRVFDAPSCGGVLLTDRTRQLENLMEPGRDVLAYESEEEIPDLLGRALREPEFRRKISEAGYKRVLQEHTYCKRLGKMIRVMRKNFG